MKFILLLFLASNIALAGSIDPETGVFEHNKWRNALNRGELGTQPRPDPFIQDMYWDAQLAESAQSHTDKCVWEHSNTGGENLYAQSGNGSTIADGIIAWKDEHHDYDFEPISANSAGPPIGHYTQLVWDESLRVGCAASQCKPLKLPDGSALWDGTYYACQYRESGNWIGELPYDVSGQNTSRVEYNSANSNLNFQLLKVGDSYFRAKMKLKSFAPLMFEFVTYQQITSSRAEGFNDIAYYDENTASLIVPRLSIDGSDRYFVELKHTGNLLFEISDGGIR